MRLSGDSPLSAVGAENLHVPRIHWTHPSPHVASIVANHVKFDSVSAGEGGAEVVVFLAEYV